MALTGSEPVIDSSKPCSSFRSIGSLDFSRSGFCFTSGLPPRFSVAGWATSFSLLCEWITAWRPLGSLYRQKRTLKTQVLAKASEADNLTLSRTEELFGAEATWQPAAVLPLDPASGVNGF